MMMTASLYPAFSRNFEDEQDYTDAAALAARRAAPLPRRLDPILRWKRQRGDEVRDNVGFLVLETSDTRKDDLSTLATSLLKGTMPSTQKWRTFFCQIAGSGWR